jgi:Fe-S cluster assembly protein SufD
MNAILKSKQEAAASRLDAAVLPEAAGWSKAAREDALARVRRMGLPSRRDECDFEIKAGGGGEPA